RPHPRGARSPPVLDGERRPARPRRPLDRAGTHGDPAPGRAGLRLRRRARAHRGRGGRVRPRLPGDADDRPPPPGRAGAAMTSAGTVLTGAGIGLLLGVGLVLVLGALPWFRPRDLEARVAPYLRRSHTTSLFSAPRPASRARA